MGCPIKGEIMFDLEKAIRSWKRSLRKNPGYEDGDIEELASHLQDRIEVLSEEGLSKREAFNAAVKEIGDPVEMATEYQKTTTRKAYADTSSGINIGILGNFLKIARRNLLKNKLYTSLNILGLVVGISCCIFIYLFVQNELNYDAFYENSEQIYKVNRWMEREDGSREAVGLTSAPFERNLETDFPDMIEMATHIGPRDGVVTIGDQTFRENRLYRADEDFFRMFSYSFIEGDPENALTRPNTVVLSRETAHKYFGDEPALGKTILVGNESVFEVTGVFEIPEGGNSHLDFDLVNSIKTFENRTFYTEWMWNSFHTYIKLSPNVDVEDLNAQLPSFTDKYFADNMATYNRRIDILLIPLNEVYFANYLTFDWQITHGDRTVISIFGIVAILIIVVAAINFINLATARSVSRSKEIGVRKTLGAKRHNLFFQFMAESLFIVSIAGFISYIVVFFMFPFFENLIGISISVNLFSSELILMVIGILLTTGILAGVYPAIFLSSFEPIKALKEKISFGTSQIVVRKGLIVFQFVISSLLIIGVTIINNQLDYISNKSLGFQPGQLLDVSLNNQEIRQQLPAFQEELEKLPGVEVTSAMSGTPGGFFDNYSFVVDNNTDEPVILNTLFIDDNFSEILDLDFIAGRDLSDEFSTDSDQAIVINERAAEHLGWTPEEALGKQLTNLLWQGEVPRTIVGVVEDFHYQSMHSQIGPLAISMVQDQRRLLAKVNTSNISQTLKNIESVWSEFSSLYPIEYRFLDEQFAELYANDIRQRKIFIVFSVVAMVIACLGLFGLTTFNAEKRSKEIGLRKILGASISNLLYVFNKEIFGIIGFSFLIAMPITYFLIEKWLQNFAYRVDNGIFNYVIALLIILTLTVLTISYQTIKVSTSNPVDSLKDE